MKTRCLNPNSKDYPNYGGRGIKVCPEWMESFEAFRDWAMANGYRDDLTLDREDVNGNYDPNNCKWSTRTEQANNKRNNHKVTANGVTHTIAEWEKITGIQNQTIHKRISRGWREEDAVLLPLGSKKPCYPD